MKDINHWLRLLSKTIDKVVFGFTDYNERDTPAKALQKQTKEECEV